MILISYVSITVGVLALLVTHSDSQQTSNDNDLSLSVSIDQTNQYAYQNSIQSSTTDYDQSASMSPINDNTLFNTDQSISGQNTITQMQSSSASLSQTDISIDASTDESQGSNTSPLLNSQTFPSSSTYDLSENNVLNPFLLDSTSSQNTGPPQQSANSSPTTNSYTDLNSSNSPESDLGIKNSNEGYRDQKTGTMYPNGYSDSSPFDNLYGRYGYPPSTGSQDTGPSQQSANSSPTANSYTDLNSSNSPKSDLGIQNSNKGYKDKNTGTMYPNGYSDSSSLDDLYGSYGYPPSTGSQDTGPSQQSANSSPTTNSYTDLNSSNSPKSDLGIQNSNKGYKDQNTGIMYPNGYMYPATETTDQTNNINSDLSPLDYLYGTYGYLPSTGLQDTGSPQQSANASPKNTNSYILPGSNQGNKNLNEGYIDKNTGAMYPNGYMYPATETTDETNGINSNSAPLDDFYGMYGHLPSTGSGESEDYGNPMYMQGPDSSSRSSFNNGINNGQGSNSDDYYQSFVQNSQNNGYGNNGAYQVNNNQLNAYFDDHNYMNVQPDSTDLTRNLNSNGKVYDYNGVYPGTASNDYDGIPLMVPNNLFMGNGNTQSSNTNPNDFAYDQSMNNNAMGSIGNGYSNGQNFPSNNGFYDMENTNNDNSNSNSYNDLLNNLNLINNMMNPATVKEGPDGPYETPMLMNSGYQGYGENNQQIDNTQMNGYGGYAPPDTNQQSDLSVYRIPISSSTTNGQIPPGHDSSSSESHPPDNAQYVYAADGSVIGIIYFYTDDSDESDDSLSDEIESDLDQLGNDISKVASNAMNKTIDGLEDSYQATKHAASVLKNYAASIADDVYDGTKDVANHVKDGVSDALNKTTDALKDGYQKTKHAANVLGDYTELIVDDVYDGAKNAAIDIKDGASNAYDDTKNFGNDVENDTPEAVNNIQNGASAVQDNVGEAVDGVAKGTANINDATQTAGSNMQADTQDFANDINQNAAAFQQNAF